MYLLRLVRLVVSRQLVEDGPRAPAAVVVVHRRLDVQIAVGDDAAVLVAGRVLVATLEPTVPAGHGLARDGKPGYKKGIKMIVFPQSLPTSLNYWTTRALADWG